MSFEKTIQELEQKGYTVSYFEKGEDAVSYLKEKIIGKKVGIGGSMTLTDLHVIEALKSNNKVVAADFPEEGEGWFEAALKTIDTDIYLTSVNAMTEDGVFVNIDQGGNRIAGSIWGHEKVYFIIGTNKIEPDLDSAIHRARNIAAPMNCKRFGMRTPCALSKEMRCYDCKSPDRLCGGMMIYFRPMGMEAEVILINEKLGF